MAEPVEFFVGFVYSVVYCGPQGQTLIIEGELLSFDDTRIEIKAAKGSATIEMIRITKILRK